MYKFPLFLVISLKPLCKAEAMFPFDGLVHENRDVSIMLDYEVLE